MDTPSFRDLLRTLGQARPPQMCYDGDDTPESFRAWQRAFGAKLRELRGQPLPRPQPPEVELLERVELADHVREHVTITSVLDTKVPAYILVPKGIRLPRPVVMALHGHRHGGKERLAAASGDPGDEAYALAAVRAGFVTLTLDWWGWGERVERGFDFGGRDMCNVKFMAASMYGVWLLSVMLSDATAALDALVGRDDVDAERVGVMGNSFGGRMSMYLAAFDQRITAAVCSGCLNCFRERSLKLTSCGAQFFPGMLQYGDVQEVFALIAPRPLMIMTGQKDPLIPHDYAEKMRAVIQRAYRILGAEDRLCFHDHTGGHELLAEPAVKWLARQLEA